MPTKKATKTVADETTGKKTMPKKTATEKAATLTEPRHSALDGFRTYTPYVEKPGEEYMNKAQADHFREILFAWRKELMEEVDRTVHHMQDEAANFPDPNDRATQESEFSMELRTRDRERKLLKKIDEALEMLDNGEYGYCESCGVEIGIRRLEARPTATLCIDCKTLDEIREKQRG
jgi:DnaK suppressor protein